MLRDFSLVFFCCFCLFWGFYSYHICSKQSNLILLLFHCVCVSVWVGESVIFSVFLLFYMHVAAFRLFIKHMINID